MGKKKDKKIDLNNLTPEEEFKLEIAAELGLFSKVIDGGWRCLTAKESGRMGGIISKRRREMKKETSEKEALEKETMK